MALTYPAIPAMTADLVDSNKAYKILLHPHECANFTTTITGQSTGCAVLLHNAIDASEYADFTFQHDLNYAKEVKEYRAKAEDEPLAVLLSAWTYVGGGPAVAGATPGWSQVQMEPGFAWDPEAGGRATATCPGSAAGPSQVEVVIKPAKAEKAATANS